MVLDVQTCGSIGELIRRRALDAPGRRAYVFLGDGRNETAALTYGQLGAKVGALAGRLRAEIPEGDRVLLLFRPGLEFIEAFFACLAAGIVAVPANPPVTRSMPRGLARLGAIVEHAQVTAVLSEPAVGDLVCSHSQDFDSLRWLHTLGSVDAPAPIWQGPDPRPERTAFLQYAPGTTEEPRAVMITHANLLHNQRRLCAAFGIGEGARVVGWTPSEPDAGMIADIVLSVVGGALGIMIPPGLLRGDPGLWLQAIARYRAQAAGGPPFAYDLASERLGPADVEALDLSCWDAAYVTGERLPVPTLRRFDKAFAPAGFRWAAFTPTYGLAESTLLVTSKPPGQEPVVINVDSSALRRGEISPAEPGAPGSRPLVSSGNLATGDQSVVIVDPDTRMPSAPDEIGEIWLRSPSVAKGYWNDAKGTEADFRARLASWRGGVHLRTGDLGFVADGQLFVVGRHKPVITINGFNKHPRDIESTVLRSHPALALGSAAVFAVEQDDHDEIVALAELSRVGRRPVQESARELRLILAAIRDSIAAEHGLGADRIALVRPHSLPKSSTGDVQRHACRQMLAEGALQVLAQSAPFDLFLRRSAPAVNDTRVD